MEHNFKQSCTSAGSISLVLRYVLLPMVVFIVVIHFLLEDVRFLCGTAIFIGILYIIGGIRSRSKLRRDTARGWRVGHIGRDAMFYEELKNGTWCRIEINGGLIMGPAHHEINFRSTTFPDWAQSRREEIVQRVKSEFHAPNYVYVDI